MHPHPLRSRAHALRHRQASTQKGGDAPRTNRPYRWASVALLSSSLVALAATAMTGLAFRGHIRALQRYLERRGPQREARADLPPEVLRLAGRLGIAADGSDAPVHLRQSGQMWLRPGGKALAFTARQTIAIGEAGFLWRAWFRPSGLPMQIVEHLADDDAGLEGRLLDILPMVALPRSDAAFRGEAMRYLAELPWAPDAIVLNPQLEWRVIDDHRLAVATGTGARRCEIHFILDEAGDPVRFEAVDRPFLRDGECVPTAWFGRCGDYQVIAGRRIPMWGEAGWHLDSGDFIYWRGRVEAWTRARRMPDLD